jgi:hypothetical protein
MYYYDNIYGKNTMFYILVATINLYLNQIKKGIFYLISFGPG